MQVHSWCLHWLGHPIATWQLLLTLLWQWLPALLALTAAAAVACLVRQKIGHQREYIYQLVEKSETDMLKTKNFGRKSLNEIKEILSELQLSLGMKLHNFPKHRIG